MKLDSSECGKPFAQPFGLSHPVHCSLPKGHEGEHATMQIMKTTPPITTDRVSKDIQESAGPTVDGYWLKMGANAAEALNDVLQRDLTKRRRKLVGEYLGGIFDGAYKMGIRVGGLQQRMKYAQDTRSSEASHNPVDGVERGLQPETESSALTGDRLSLAAAAARFRAIKFWFNDGPDKLTTEEKLEVLEFYAKQCAPEPPSADVSALAREVAEKIVTMLDGLLMEGSKWWNSRTAIWNTIAAIITPYIAGQSVWDEAIAIVKEERHGKALHQEWSQVHHDAVDRTIAALEAARGQTTATTTSDKVWDKVFDVVKAMSEHYYERDKNNRDAQGSIAAVTQGVLVLLRQQLEQARDRSRPESSVAKCANCNTEIPPDTTFAVCAPCWNERGRVAIDVSAATTANVGFKSINYSECLRLN